MSSPEVEKFEITQDDLDDEFNPQRKTFRQSKNQSIYGIWAPPEDSDDEDYGGRGSSGRRKKNFTAPMNFISGGFKKGSKEEEEEIDKEDEEQHPDSDEDVQPSFPMFGSRMGKAKGGNQRYYKKGAHPGDEGQFGDWEKYTRGIGAKLLSKMGHVAGKGLGKNLQGIQAPVTTKKRDGKGAIGYYGSERTKQSLIHYPVEADQDEIEEKEFKEKLQQWKKTDSKPAKKKYTYKTVDELLSKPGITKKKVTQSQLSNVKVIDMTQKEQRVLSGYHAISSKHNKPDEEEDTYAVQSYQQKRAFEMPELMHNLNMLVDMAEDEIINNERRLRHEKDNVVNITYEHQKINELCEHEEKQIKKLQEIVSLVESLEVRTKEGCESPLTLEECADMFRKLQDSYYEEYKMYDLGTVAMAIVFPVMKKYFIHWKPLEYSRYGLETIRHWKNILEDPTKHYMDNQMDPYHKLMWEIWMPCLRSAMASWNVRDCDPVIEILENWLDLIPTWIFENIADLLIMPKLTKEVEDWNPLTDTMPIHSWIHPWLPLIKNKLEPLYAPIRHKMANALKNWYPSDPSAKMILTPWKGVFPQGHLDAFVVKNILPKLQITMQEFVINPHQQHLDNWNWVMLWRDLLPSQHMVSLLHKFFFSKWIQVLCTWLGNQPNFDEVTKWYTGWKSMFGDTLLANVAVKEEFNKALDIMNRAVSNVHVQPTARDSASVYLNAPVRPQYQLPRAPPPPPAPSQSIQGATASTSVPTSFKDLIEKKAEENDLIFVPIPNRTYEGKQVYKFGNVQIYIDRSVVFINENNIWQPTSLNNLVQKGKFG